MNEIIKMEFHEFKSRSCIVPMIDLYCYIKDITSFLQLCTGKEAWAEGFGTKSIFEYELRRIKNSKAQRPHFDLNIMRSSVDSTTIEIYPKENLLIKHEAGLHYICQHIFDFLPHDIKSNFYPVSERNNFVIGELIIDHGKNKGQHLIVKACDILKGFMLDKYEIKQFNDTFSIWIASQRQKEKDGVKENV